MPTKVFCPLLGLAAAYLAVVLGVAAAPPWWLLVLLLLVVLGGLRWWATREIRRSRIVFVEVPAHEREWMLHAVTAALSANGLWVLSFLLIRPPAFTVSWLWWLGVPPALAVLEIAVAAAWDRSVRHVAPARPVTDPGAVDLFEAELVGRPPTPADLLRTALEMIDRGHIQVLDAGWRELDYGLPLPQGVDGPLGFVFTTRLPSAMAVRIAAEAALARAEGHARTPGRGEIKPLTGDDAEMLAIAWSELTGVPMMADWVKITRERLAGITTVTVVMVDVHAMAFPYPLEGRTHRGPKAQLGLQIDARPVEYNLRQHLALVGNTGSGKTTALAVLIGEATLPEEEGGPLPRLIVGGCRKVYDLVGQWFDPFLPSLDPDRPNPLADLPLPFEAVNGFDDTLAKLVEVMDEALRRQNLPHADRVGLHDIYLAIDEIPTFLTHPGQVQWQGRWWTASDLYAEGRRILRSAGIFLIDLAQQWSNAMYGEAASSIKHNSQALMLMRSMNGDERGDMFGKGGAAMGDLYQPGQFYLRDAAAPITGKTFYIQEMDARLDRRHDGPTVADVAIARARLRAQRGDYSTGQMTHDHRDYLRGVGAYAPSGDTTAPASPTDEIRALAAEIEAARPPAPAAVMPPAPAPVKPPTRADRIVALVQDHGAAMQRGQIHQALHDAGDPVSWEMLDKELGKLYRSGRLAKPEVGVYATT